MGADIHVVLEKKYQDKWVGVTTFPYQRVEYNEGDVEKARGADIYLPMFARSRVRGRNYELFGALAGVRRDGPEPRGVPVDVSDLAAMEIEGWGSDGHSHSWLPMDEALPIFASHHWPEKMLDDGFRSYAANELFDIEYEERDQYRIVFWFDN